MPPQIVATSIGGALYDRPGLALGADGVPDERVSDGTGRAGRHWRRDVAKLKVAGPSPVVRWRRLSGVRGRGVALHSVVMHTLQPASRCEDPVMERDGKGATVA